MPQASKSPKWPPLQDSSQPGYIECVCDPDETCVSGTPQISVALGAKGAIHITLALDSVPTTTMEQQVGPYIIHCGISPHPKVAVKRLADDGDDTAGTRYQCAPACILGCASGGRFAMLYELWQCLEQTACGPLQDALQHEKLAPNATAYGYCNLQVLHGACDLLLQPPATIPLDGEIFSTTEQVNVTQPTPTSTFNSDARVGMLSYGAIAGIAIGAIVVLLIIMGCFVILSGKRKRKAYLRQRERLRKNWPSGGGAGEMFETPVSQQPLRGWGDSPISATTDRSYPQYFSPYTSQYNSPVSGAEGPSHMHTAWPAEKARNIGVAASPDSDGAVYWANDGKGKDRAGTDADGEGYELQEGINSGGGHQHPPMPPPPHQAPVLNHPGYGRYGPPPPASSTS
ncbi:hypothetical protein DL762_001577 [Monosporascus cannonballus]|uniref:Uncharacterized protein n=1 Tax=Monosporascus cannonballus TaxID=155416 RepID=A0ABY0HGD8_9PEZI|nr:hypothetical protein DL762_001577 [Monosporascus cannonballus]RYP00306.1 hypothetical protein DL763_000917 [Monosporascus cannonballus]